MKTSLCTCGEPLVTTMAFRKHELYCIWDGRMYGLFEAEQAEETPALADRYAWNLAEWKELSEGLIGDGVHFEACDRCSREEHLLHATEEEKQGDAVARATLTSFANRADPSWREKTVSR